MSDLHRHVEAAAHLCAAEAEWEDHKLAEGLQASGLDASLAERLVAFVPLAFGRLILARNTESFSDHYVIPDSVNGDRRLPLTGEPIFELASALAMQWLQDGRRREVVRIGSRSCEVQTALALRDGDGVPTDLHFTDPVCLRLRGPE